MKFGVLWFLHLDKILQCFKFFLIPLFVIGFVTPIDSKIFLVSWCLFGICALISIVVFAIRPPSNAKMEAFISKYQEEFREKRANEFRNYSKVEMQMLLCFSDAGKVKFTHMLGRKTVRSRLVMLAFVRTKDELWLIVSEKSLLSGRPAETKRYQLEHINDIQWNQTPVDEDEMAFVVRIQNDKFELFVRNDYHLRDFISNFHV